MTLTTGIPWISHVPGRHFGHYNPTQRRKEMLDWGSGVNYLRSVNIKTLNILII